MLGMPFFLDASPDNLAGIATFVDSSAIGNGGNITIITPFLSLSNGALILANTLGQGNAGSIAISTEQFSLTNGTLSTSSSATQGNAGSIFIFATDTFVADDSLITGNLGSTEEVPAVGKAGNILIEAREVSLTNTAQVQTRLFSGARGEPGTISVTAEDSISFTGENTGIFGNTQVDSAGDASDIDITTNSLTVSNGAILSASNSGQGKGGNITINATNSFALNEGGISTSSAGQGDAGNITINATNSFVATNNSRITSNIGSSTGTAARGRVGNISISSRDISFSDASQIQAGAFIGATATQSGTVSLTATERISLTGTNTGIFSNNDSGSLGDASNARLSAPNIVLNDGAILGASNSGQGKGGNVTINATDNVSFTNDSNIFVIASEDNAGNIDITTNSLIVSDGASLSARNSGQGKGGDVTINATDDVSFTNGSSIVVTGSEGGSINISAKNLSLINESAFFAGIDIDSGFADAQSGDIIIKLTEDLVLDGLDGENVTSIINNNVGTGNAGNIEITARNISFTNGGNVTSFSNGLGNTGDIILKATENIAFDGNRNSSLSGIQSAVTDEGEGASGNITIDAKNLSLTNGASIDTLVGGVGNSGNINIKVRDFVAIDGETGEVELQDGTLGIFASSIRSDVIGLGNSGDINLTTQNLTITNGGNILASIEGQGRAGKINLTTNNLFVDGQGSNTPSAIESSILLGGIGNGGSIEITTEQFSLTNGASLTTSSAGQGNAGNIFILATDTFVADDSLIVSNIGSPQGVPAVGKVGSIFIEAKEVSLTDTAQIQAGLFSGARGESGMVSVKAEESISFTGKDTGIFSDTEVDAVGNGSDIQLSAPSIFLSDGAGLTADNAGEGNGGSIEITTEQLSLTNEAGVNSNSRGEGNGGTIEITTEQLSLTNGASLNTTSIGQGDAGNISLSATDKFVADDSLITSNIGSPQGASAVGKVGNIFIEAREVSLTDTAQIQAAVLSGARGEESGKISLTAKDSISFTGEDTGIFSNTQIEALGDASDIQLSAPSIFLGDGTVLFANNAGEGNGGNIDVNADELQMNRGRISAATASGTGGEINLQIADNLILKNNSLISARADNDANGGNIDIDAEFIIAFPNQNNDIIASAEQGTGGNINITAEAIFGIQERKATPGNETNDIDASSEFGQSGNVTFNVPDTNIFQDTGELSSNVISAESISENACAATGQSGLILKGKGGVPPAPNLPLSSAILLDSDKPITPNFSQLNNQQQAINNNRFQIQPVKTSVGDIYPARGVIVREDGTVTLTAYPTNNIATRTPENAVNCNQTMQ